MVNSKIIRFLSCLLLIHSISIGQAKSQADKDDYNFTAISNARVLTKPETRYLFENANNPSEGSLYNSEDSLKQNHKRTFFYQGKLDGTFSSTFGVDIVNSLSVADIVAIGVGAGLRFPLSYKVISAPLYLDFRLTLSQHHIAPIIEVGWGFTFEPNTYYENTGQIWLVEAGVKIKGKEKFAYTIGFGFESYDIIAPSKSAWYYPAYSHTSGKTKTIESVTFNLGFIF